MAAIALSHAPLRRSRRPEVNGLAADQHIGLAFSVPLREDVAELFEGKAHGMPLHVTQPRLLGHGFHDLAQIGNPAFAPYVKRTAARKQSLSDSSCLRDAHRSCAGGPLRV